MTETGEEGRERGVGGGDTIVSGDVEVRGDLLLDIFFDFLEGEEGGGVRERKCEMQNNERKSPQQHLQTSSKAAKWQSPNDPFAPKLDIKPRSFPSENTMHAPVGASQAPDLSWTPMGKKRREGKIWRREIFC